MRILCGTDFTPAADAAAEAARAIASRTGGTLRLVHVADAGDRKAQQTAAATSAPGAPPTSEVSVLFGNPDEAIVAEAERIGADLIVVGALGRRSPRWRLGSTADRIAQQASCPVLVVRDAQPFRRWANGEGPLRISVGLDTAASSEALVRYLSRLTAAGPCSLIGVHIYWPPEARERLHLHGGLLLGSGNVEVDTAIERELRARIPVTSGEAPMELRIVGGLGRIADHLIQIAQEVNAEVNAVGSHQRSGLDRLWHGSISHGVIDGSPMSVLCVPSR
jgi:nucleotide-binding universal stress UspA family protein